MQEEVVAEKEISLMDVLRALIVKWKILLLVIDCKTPLKGVIIIWR
jgi:hypothetical protein